MVHGEVDLPLLKAAAEMTQGQHDFTAFTPIETEHLYFRRTVSKCAWKRTTADLAALARGGGGDAGKRHGLLYLEIEADSFLRHMVRTLVGTMFEIAQGKRPLEDLARLLEGARRDDSGLTAPPYGLFLWDVRYPRGQEHGKIGSLGDDSHA